jgi:hypothetical protein
MATPDEWKSIGVIRKSVPVNEAEARLSRDLPAYKRLRRNGTQPRQINGCAELELKASDRLEVELGHVFPDRKDLEAARDGMRQAEDIKLGLA